MEAPCNPAYQQYLAERAEEEAWRVRLQEGREEGEDMEVRGQGEGMDSTQFLPSMASHCIMPTQVCSEYDAHAHAHAQAQAHDSCS